MCDDKNRLALFRYANELTHKFMQTHLISIKSESMLRCESALAAQISDYDLVLIEGNRIARNLVTNMDNFRNIIG